MEPIKPVAPIITAFVHQARKAATPELSEHVERLSNSQIALALKIIRNKDNFWGSYAEGSDKKMEKELVNILMILAGGTGENKKEGFSFELFFKDRDKEITKLINTIHRSSLQMNQPQIFEEKSTDMLLWEMIKASLSSDAEVTAQLYRDLDGLKGKVKIDDHDIEIVKPAKCPADWDKLIPQEIKNFIGPDYRSIAPSVAIFLTQGIAVDPYQKAIEILQDPSLPDATVDVNKYPHFKFTKHNADVILEVTNQATVGLLNMETAKIAPVKSYEITQTINLTTPTELVKMIIKPKNIEQ